MTQQKNDPVVQALIDQRNGALDSLAQTIGTVENLKEQLKTVTDKNTELNDLNTKLAEDVVKVLDEVDRLQERLEHYQKLDIPDIDIHAEWMESTHSPETPDGEI